MPGGGRRIIGAGREYRHPKTLWGLPLVNVVSGRDPRTGRRRVARGIVAIGQCSVGLIAIGQLAVGLVAIGQLALGVVAALGQGAVGLVATGQLAVSTFFSGGQLALGKVAVGQLAMGSTVLGQKTLVPPPYLLFLCVGAAFVISGGFVSWAQRRRLNGWSPLLSGGSEVQQIGEGAARTEQPLESPVGRHPCVWYRVRAVDPATGRILSEEISSAGFYLEHGTSRTRVVPENARLWTSAEWTTTGAHKHWLDQHPPEELLASGLAPLVAEEWLPLGSWVRLAGPATSESDPHSDRAGYRSTGTRRSFATTEQTPLLITSEPIKEVTANLKLGPMVGRLQLTVGIMCLLVALLSVLSVS